MPLQVNCRVDSGGQIIWLCKMFFYVEGRQPRATKIKQESPLKCRSLGKFSLIFSSPQSRWGTLITPTPTVTSIHSFEQVNIKLIKSFTSLLTHLYSSLQAWMCIITPTLNYFMNLPTTKHTHLLMKSVMAPAHSISTTSTRQISSTRTVTEPTVMVGGEGTRWKLWPFSRFSRSREWARYV